MRLSTVAVMAKPPVPERCKTRLARTIGPARAAVLYRAMLEDTLDRLERVPNVRRVVLAAPEHEGITILRAIAPPNWEVIAQRGEDLGDRLKNGVIDLHAANERVGLLDSDSPTLPIESIVTRARSSSFSKSAWVGPCEDGGYYLIALSREQLGLLDQIPWSTAEVMQATRARAKSLGIALEELATGYDVDDERGLARLRCELRQSPALAPRCARALREELPP